MPSAARDLRRGRSRPRPAPRRACRARPAPRRAARLHRRAVMAQPPEARHAPALHRARDDAERLAGATLRPGCEARPRSRRIVAVDGHRGPAERLGLALQVLPAPAPARRIALAQRVAVEDRDHVAELLVGDEIHRLPDLALARFAVADDAVDRLVDAVDPRGGASPAATDSPWPSEPVAASKNGKPSTGLGWPSIGLSMARSVIRSSIVIGLGLPCGLEGHAEIGAGGIDDRHRMAFRQHQPVGAAARADAAGSQRMTRYISTATRCASDSAVVGMAAAGRRGGPHRELADLDRLGVDDLIRRCHRCSPGAG